MAEKNQVRLRPFSDAHLTARYVGWLNDAETMRYSERRGGGHTMESCRDYATTMVANGDWFLAIHAGAGMECDPHVGNVSVYFDRVNRNAEIAILIGDAAMRGHKIGFRAFAAACARIWENSDTEKIMAGTLAVNPAMIGVMRRAGMTPDGVRARHVIWNDDRVDIVHYALFRDAKQMSLNQ